MAIFTDNIVDVDLKSGTVWRNFADCIVGEGDKNTVRFGARVFSGEYEAILTDYSARGYFIRPDGTTIELGGQIERNTVFITLTNDCCAYEGNFTLSIKLSGNNELLTLRIVDGTIVNTIDDGDYILSSDVILYSPTRKIIYDNRTFMDVSDTTATAEDVKPGKYFYNASGIKTEGNGNFTVQFGNNVSVVSLGDDNYRFVFT